jgi:hypothetical protein
MLDCWLRGVANIGWKGGRIWVIRPCLEQEHSPVGVLAQPRGEDAASRTSPDDDGVELHGGNLGPLSMAMHV